MYKKLLFEYLSSYLSTVPGNPFAEFLQEILEEISILVNTSLNRGSLSFILPLTNICKTQKLRTLFSKHFVALSSPLKVLG